MRTVGILSAIGLVSFTSLFAQSPQTPQQPPVFRAGIDLVQLDVSVLDKNGLPVRGLKAEDFIVNEDGKPQSIEHCDEIAVASAAPPTAKWMAGITSDVVTNDLQDRRLVAIVIDDAMLFNWPPAVKNTKQIAKQVIDGLSPGDLASVIFTRDSRSAQDFTSNHAKLLAAAEKASSGFAFSSDRATSEPNSALKAPDPDEYWFKSAVQVVANVADFLIDVPQRRKVLVYISTGVPFDLESGSGAGMGTAADPEKRELMLGILAKMEHAITRAQRANVSVYSFDPAGRDGLEGYFSTPLAHNVPHDPTGAADFATKMRGYLQGLATSTGGRAVVNTGDFTPGIETMFKENSSYYLLGYSQSNPKKPGNFSRLDVKVNRPDVVVRHRSVTYAQEPEPAGGRNSATAEAISGMLPNPSAPLRVSVAPFARAIAAGEKGAAAAATSALVITLGVTKDAPEQRSIEHIDLLTSAFAPDGKPQGTQSQTADVTMRAADKPAPGAKPERAEFEVLSQMPLKPGRYQLRLAADHTTAGKTGSVFIDVDVPDFVKAPLSLSGVLLDAMPRPIAAPPDALASIVPVTPTIEREFPSTAQVRTFMRVYQGNKTQLQPVEVRTTITNDHDGVEYSGTTTIAPLKFSAAREAEFRFDLPLTQLKPGVYLVTFEAAAGKANARRDVVIRVRP